LGQIFPDFPGAFVTFSSSRNRPAITGKNYQRMWKRDFSHRDRFAHKTPRKAGSARCFAANVTNDWRLARGLLCMNASPTQYLRSQAMKLTHTESNRTRPTARREGRLPVEDVLCELAIALHLTRRVKTAIVSDRTRPTSPRPVDRPHVVAMV
jgi:hypothetical protein